VNVGLVEAAMADSKVPSPYADPLPSVFGDLGRPGELATGNAWFGREHSVLARRQRAVDASTSHLKAREAQHDQYGRLIDAKMRIMRKIAEVADLPNLIAEEQRQREHARILAEHRRVLDGVNATHDLELALARQNVELTRVREQGVRAQRNLQAAERVSDVEVARWYAEAQARANNAEAERQDTAVDLARGSQVASAPTVAQGAAAKQRAQDLQTVEHQIELERERGNQAAVLALMNLRARLKAA
jgi:hypothetical protein